MPRTRLCVLLWTAAFLLAPAAALAVPRYAAPLGGGTACTSDTPCAIDVAIGSAPADAEVIVESGDYGSASAPLTGPITNANSGLAIHGEDGKPRPRIFVTAGNDGIGVQLSGGITARHLEIQMSSVNGARQAALVLGGATATDIVSHTTTPQGKACVVLGDATLTDATCVADLAASFGVTGFLGVGPGGLNHSVLRNVTAVAMGTSSVGIQAEAGNNAGEDEHFTISNSIARGQPGQTDVAALNPGAGNATITIDHSNFGFQSQTTPGTGQFTDAGGNQRFMAIPFAGAGDYHQAAGAVTIDAGADDAANGTVDVDGDERTLGAHTDIGADEFVPAPLAVTGDPGAATVSTAVLNGSVNPERLATSWHFEYGTTTAYGSSTPDTDAGAGGADVPASATVEGLAPMTAYHYRLVASSRGGTTVGEDKVVTTMMSPPPPPPPPPFVTPRILRLALTPRTFTAARKGGSVRAAKKRRPVGTTVSVTVNRAAVVTFSVERRGKKGRYKRVPGSFRINAVTGQSRFRFAGRLRGHKLRPGRYRLRAVTGKAPVKRAKFRIVR